MGMADKGVSAGKRGATQGKHGAGNQGVMAGQGGKKGRATNPATGKVNKNGTGGGPGGSK